MYDADSGSYLARAKKCFEREEPEFLFYTALELRCYIETRQNEYLWAAERYRKSWPKRWNIGQQNSELRKIYAKEQIQRIIQRFEDGYELFMEFVPVTTALKLRGEKLGSLLHSQDKKLVKNQLDVIRSDLEMTFGECEICNAGNLMCPALISNDGKLIGPVELIVPWETLEHIKARLGAGTKVTLDVSYLDLWRSSKADGSQKPVIRDLGT